jgi:superfamily II DNA/RNA helicase
LKQLVRQNQISQAFVFVNSKLGCARLSRSLERDGLKTAALHGDKSQDERLKSLEAFKSGEVDLLICTDVAARGLDIKDVPAVFNFDVPYNAEDYVHRIGRTGRAGASGLAISFVNSSDSKLVGDIEKLIKKKVELEPVEFENDFNDGSDRSRRELSREGHRNFRDRESVFDQSGSRHADEHSPYQNKNRSRVQTPQDPFFDKPYESNSLEGHTPSWETVAKPAGRSISANIKTKRKVAALFKTEPTST